MILEVVQSKWSLTWYDPLGYSGCLELRTNWMGEVTCVFERRSAAEHVKISMEVSTEVENSACVISTTTTIHNKRK